MAAGHKYLCEIKTRRDSDKVNGIPPPVKTGCFQMGHWMSPRDMREINQIVDWKGWTKNGLRPPPLPPKRIMSQNSKEAVRFWCCGGPICFGERLKNRPPRTEALDTWPKDIEQGSRVPLNRIQKSRDVGLWKRSLKERKKCTDCY